MMEKSNTTREEETTDVSKREQTPLPHPIWDEIELSESYLVCSMFEEALSLSSSVVQRLREDVLVEVIMEDVEWNDMIVSAGMVLVQSLNQLRRTAVLEELKQVFGSVTAVPVQVLLSGVCFQMQESPFGVREFLEEFLSKWRCVDGRYYVLESAEGNAKFLNGFDNQFVVGFDTYLQVVEVFVFTLLTVVLNDMDFAISWAEKAELPEQTRQELLRRVHSVHSSKVSSYLQAASSTSMGDEHGSVSLGSVNLHEMSSNSLQSGYLVTEENNRKQTILKLSRQKAPCLWWFRSINLKFGSTRLAVSNGSALLACLILLMFYFMRRKKATIIRLLKRLESFSKKAAVDLWQLAFSYQVNPLAAVEPLHSATRGGNR